MKLSKSDEQKFRKELDELHLEFKGYKSVKRIDKEFEKLQDANYHSECSLLMVTHYGTEEQAEMIKDLIVRQRRTFAPNRAYIKRIKITSEFYKIHKLALEQIKK